MAQDNKRKLELIYDGECPICSSLAIKARLERDYELILVDARSHPKIVNELKSKGLDLNEGIIISESGVDCVSLSSWISIFWQMIQRAAFNETLVSDPLVENRVTGVTVAHDKTSLTEFRYIVIPAAYLPDSRRSAWFWRSIDNN